MFAVDHCHAQKFLTLPKFFISLPEKLNFAQISETWGAIGPLPPVRYGYVHGISGTRWSNRLERVKPFVAHLPGVTLALENLLELNITPKTRKEIHGVICYVRSFTCIIISVVWHRILVPIDFCNNVIRAIATTLDMEVANIAKKEENIARKLQRKLACTTSGSLRQLESDLE